MTKIKKIVAAAAAVVGMSAIGLTAFAASANFSFSLESRDDLYCDATFELKKDTLWVDPARVLVTKGNVSSNNSAEIFISANPSWPETDIISDSKYVTKCSATPYKLHYDTESPDLPSNWTVCLVARTGDASVNFAGEWMP